MDKQLRDKAISIRGKAYVQVKDRVLFFNEEYEQGYIKTELLSEPGAADIVFKATVRPDKDSEREFVAHAQEKVSNSGVNANAALENAETSAIGRALALMGIGVIDSVASVDEMAKAGAIDDDFNIV